MESLLAHIFVGSQGELASSWAQHSRRYASPSLSVTVYCLSEFPSSPSEIWGTWGGKRCPGRRKGMEGGEVRRSRQSPGGIIRFRLTGLLGSPGQDPLAQFSIPHRPGTPLLPPPHLLRAATCHPHISAWKSLTPGTPPPSAISLDTPTPCFPGSCVWIILSCTVIAFWGTCIPCRP